MRPETSKHDGLNRTAPSSSTVTSTASSWQQAASSWLPACNPAPDKTTKQPINKAAHTQRQVAAAQEFAQKGNLSKCCQLLLEGPPADSSRTTSRETPSPNASSTPLPKGSCGPTLNGCHKSIWQSWMVHSRTPWTTPHKPTSRRGLCGVHLQPSPVLSDS